MASYLRKAAVVAVVATLATFLFWTLALFALMQNVESNIQNRTLRLHCSAWSLTCEYELDQHGALEEWLFGVAAELHFRKLMPCDYLFNLQHSFAPYPNWLHHLFPIRLCPVGW